MSMQASAALSFTVADGITGNTSLTKIIAGLSFAAASELAYQVNQLIGLTPVTLTLPITPVPFFYLKNTSSTAGQIITPTITPATSLSSPAAPTLGSTGGGALTATTYFVKITYVNAFGETLPSTEASQAVLANNVLTVTSPAAAGTGAGIATGWNVYISNTAGGGSNTETKQNASPIPIGTNFTEPTSGLIAGSAVPTANTASGSTGAAVASRPLLPGSAMLHVDPTLGGGLYAIQLVGNQAGIPCEYIAVA